MDHRLEKFLAILEHGSFTQAAVALHVSQPALTVAINELEKDMGTRLLNRKRGNFGVTDAGQIVYQTALRMRSELNAMKQLMSEHSNLAPIVARVGLLDSVAELLFTTDKMLDSDLHKIEVKVDNSTRILEDLKYGRLDIGVIAVPTTPIADNLVATSLGDEQFVFVGRSEVVTKASPNSIDNWLAVNQASNTYACFSAEFERLGITVTPIFFSTSMELLKTMALQGRGLALLPLHFCRDEINAGELACLNLPVLNRPLLLVTPKGHQPTSAVEHLVSTLSELFMNRS